jgi:cell wall-associated NlpC family hydrolase
MFIRDTEVPPMLAEEVVLRAKSQLLRKTIYMLGHGGMHAEQPGPQDSLNQCDCSGFTAWCLGVSRRTENPWYKQANGGWMNTNMIFRDCATTYGVFDGIPWKEACPGDLIVFQAAPVGHVGIVTESNNVDGPMRVIHCSSSNYRANKDAIHETDTAVFRANGARIARCCWVQYPVVVA